MNLVEGSKQPGVMSAVGQRREQITTRDLASYFRILAKRLGAIKWGNATEHAKDVGWAQIEIKTRAILRAMQPTLIQVLASNLTLAMIEGDRLSIIQESDTTTGEDDSPANPSSHGTKVVTPKVTFPDKVGLSGREAASWAADRAGTLVKGLDQTTLDLLQSAVSQGITDQMGVGGLGRLIREVVQDMSVRRAEVIASTEMNHAFSEAAIRKMGRLGFEYKRWILSPGACDDCGENEDDGPIPITDTFSSGDLRPPVHPWCRCAIVAARPEDDGEGDA